MMRKTNLLWAIVVFATILLSGCGGIKEKSETEIKTDIMREDYCYSKYNINIDSFNITKRQTNVDSKTDYVWVSVAGEADDFNYYAEYELLYILYNDGWLLEDGKTLDNDYIPKKLPGHEIADSAVENQFSLYEYISCTENPYSNKSVTFHYTASEKMSDYLTLEYEISVPVWFHMDGGWEVNEVKKGEGRFVWDIEGIYSYHDGKINIAADILSYDDSDPKNVQITIDVSWNTDRASASTNGYVDYSMVTWNAQHVLGNGRVSGLIHEGTTQTHIDIVGVYQNSMAYKGKNAGVWISVWDGAEHYDCWLTRE